MAKPRCQFVVPPAPRDQDAKPYWCPDCKRDKKWNEYSKRAQCPECRSEEWCPTCKSTQIKGRDYCELTADQQWAKRQRFEVMFYLFVCMPITFIVLPALYWISVCALVGGRACH